MNPDPALTAGVRLVRHAQLIRVFSVFSIVLLLLVPSCWAPGGLMNRGLYWVGYLLLLVCVGGRLWSLLYISGQKSWGLVDQGPYSLVRNPLYVFNLVGAAGAGLCHSSMVAAVILAGGLALLYTVVVAAEERYLGAIHGPAYEAFKERVPRWIPNRRSWSPLPEVTIQPRLYMRGVVEAMSFLALPFLLALLGRLQAAGRIGLSFTLP